MDRRLRFGDADPSKVDLWFNELFENGELRWIDQRTKAEEEVEAEIWGTLPDESLGPSIRPPSGNASSYAPHSIVSDRVERRIKPLFEAFDRIAAFVGTSDKIVLSNLVFLSTKRIIPDSVLTEANVNLLLGLVRDFAANTGLHVPDTGSDNSKPSTSSSFNYNDILNSSSNTNIKDKIVERVLMIFSRWCRSGSPQWNRPPQVYYSHPMSSEWSSADIDASNGDTTRSVLVLKRHTMSTLNDYILKILQSATKNISLTTQCFVQLAHSTIVLEPPEKDMPTQVFFHYMQYGPMRELDRTLYWKLVEALSILMRNLTSLDRVLEVASIILNAWNTLGAPFDSRPPFGVPLPTEAQHLPPNPLLSNEPTKLVITSTHPQHSQNSSHTPKLRIRKKLPSLRHQSDVFVLFRSVALWRRYDQGWSEAADEEIQALALTMQYNFVNGPPQAQVMALMAAMGILDALVKSDSLTSYTVSVLYNMLTSATMRVARNDVDIRGEWRAWRQSVAVIVSTFEQSFPNLDDTLLLQIVVDVLLEDACNVEYLFHGDHKSETLAETMTKLESQKSDFLFSLIPQLTRSVCMLFNHTNHASLHDATIFKFHTYALRLHHMWRVHQPKYRSMHANHQSASSESNHGGGVEKAAKQLLQAIFAAFVQAFEVILPSLSYKQITRTIEALGYAEFAASKQIESRYDSLLAALVDRFHELRPGENWLPKIFNIGVETIFNSAKPTRETSLKLDRPSLSRVKQCFTILQHTCVYYPQFVTRYILERLGLLNLLFWMLENPYGRINKKAHETFAVLFMQPALMQSEPFVLKTETPSKRKNRQLKPSHASSASSSLSQSSPSTQLEYLPSSFLEEILPYYWKIALENYPEKTKTESIQLVGVSLLGVILPSDSPYIPYLLNTFMDKLSSLKMSKSTGALVRVAFAFIWVIKISALPMFLARLQDYIAQNPTKLQLFLCKTLLDAITANSDYSRKEMLSTWYMRLVNSLGLHANL